MADPYVSSNLTNNHLLNTDNDLFYNDLIFKQKIIDFFCLNIKKNISDASFKELIIEENLNVIWNILKNNNDIQLFNLILTVKYCLPLLDLQTPFTNVEKKIYQNVSKERFCFLLILTLRKIIESAFNEMIKSESDIINKPIWTAVNLDLFYSLDMDHLVFDLKKKNPELWKKIVSVNIIICSLERLKGVYLYTKLKTNKNYPQELTDNIKFTKGYLVCFSPILTEKFKNYKYTRKLIKNTPVFIKKKTKKLNLIESLLNENFTYPIWLNQKNLASLPFKNYNIYNKHLLKKNSKIELAVDSLNYLNSIKFAYNKTLWKKIIEGLEKSIDISSTLSTKNKLKNIVYIINSQPKEEGINNSPTNLQSLITSASALDLISKQLNYYNYFYLDHRLDSRLRIYCYPWPINYQLNHVIRVILKLYNFCDIKKILKHFKQNHLINKYAQGFNFLEHTKIKNLKTLDAVFIALNINCEDAEILELKKEWAFYLMCKLAPTNLKEIESKLNFSLQIFKNFVEDDLTENWKIWTKTLKLKDKKLPYLFSLQQSFKDLMEDKFETIFWGDASSNAVQLITFRLQIFNDKLLMLTNIIDNETEYENIYDYVAEQIKKINHDSILKKLKYKITLDELLHLSDKDLFKFLIMPSSYGMGKNSYIDKVNKILIDNDKENIWSKLSKIEQKELSNYFWDSCVNCLSELGYNLNSYKDYCKDFWKENDFDLFIWKNDMSVTLAPINITEVSRHEILSDLNYLKLEKAKAHTEEQKNQVARKKIKLEKKLKQDETDNWKRTYVKSLKSNVFVRIPYQKKKNLDKHAIRQALIPNTIHAYDASIMHVVIKICKKLGIEVLTIHDSLGCHPLLAPLVKTIFKVVNIHFLELSFKNKKFPLDKISTVKISESRKKILYTKILESKNFFR